MAADSKKVMITGGAGFIGSELARQAIARGHRVEVVDTTGAGDASCGGFLYAWLQGWDLEKCARLANAVVGLTVQHMGGAEAVTGLDQALAFMETLS